METTENKDLEERFRKMNSFKITEFDIDRLKSLDKLSVDIIMNIIWNLKIKILSDTMSNWKVSEKDMNYLNGGLDALATLNQEISDHYNMRYIENNNKK